MLQYKCSAITSIQPVVAWWHNPAWATAIVAVIASIVAIASLTAQNRNAKKARELAIGEEWISELRKHSGDFLFFVQGFLSEHEILRLPFGTVITESLYKGNIADIEKRTSPWIEKVGSARARLLLLIGDTAAQKALAELVESAWRTLSLFNKQVRERHATTVKIELSYLEVEIIKAVKAIILEKEMSLV